jgi:hypothetical protein
MIDFSKLWFVINEFLLPPIREARLNGSYQIPSCCENNCTDTRPDDRKFYKPLYHDDSLIMMLAAGQSSENGF